MSYEKAERTPADLLRESAAGLSSAAEQLSDAGGVVSRIRTELAHAEEALGQSQATFDNSLRDFRGLLDQYGLMIGDVPSVPDRRR